MVRTPVVYSAVEPDDDMLTDDAFKERAGTWQVLLLLLGRLWLLWLLSR